MSEVSVMSIALRSGDVYTVVEKPVRVSEWENEREWERMKENKGTWQWRALISYIAMSCSRTGNKLHVVYCIKSLVPSLILYLYCIEKKKSHFYRKKKTHIILSLIFYKWNILLCHKYKLQYHLQPTVCISLCVSCNMKTVISIWAKGHDW